MIINVIDNDEIRIDKYLIDKIDISRSKIQKLIDDGKILVNNKIAKPSTDIKIGDIITINYYKKIMEVKVKSLVPSVKKEDAVAMYEIIKIEES